MYKLVKQPLTNNIISVKRMEDNTFIPFDPANTDYATFKADILTDKATLQDADGNEMTAQQARDFVKELP